jgi:hypothetical protein
MRTFVMLGCALAVALGGAGCSSAPEKDASAQPARVYRTGSNIAVRDPESTMGVLTVRPDEVHTTNMPKPPTSGN